MISEERIHELANGLSRQLKDSPTLRLEQFRNAIRTAAQEAAAEQVRKDADIAFPTGAVSQGGCEVFQENVRLRILAQLPPTKTEGE